MAHLSPGRAKAEFQRSEFRFYRRTGKGGSLRCLECGCADYFQCKLIHYGQQYHVDPQRFSAEPRRRKSVAVNDYIEYCAENAFFVANASVSVKKLQEKGAWFSSSRF